MITGVAVKHTLISVQAGIAFHAGTGGLHSAEN
jgi:hypothetical protein